MGCLLKVRPFRASRKGCLFTGVLIQAGNETRYSNYTARWAGHEKYRL
jgi:hypothetical protein